MKAKIKITKACDTAIKGKFESIKKVHDKSINVFDYLGIKKIFE